MYIVNMVMLYFRDLLVRSYCLIYCLCIIIWIGIEYIDDIVNLMIF